jgi:hypothetical protein
VKFEGDVCIRSGGLASLLIDISGVFRPSCWPITATCISGTELIAASPLIRITLAWPRPTTYFKAQCDMLAGRHLTVGGDVIHQGAAVGFYNTPPASQAAASADLVDNSGGSAAGTIAAITDTATSGSADVGPTNDATASLALKVTDCLSALRRVALIAP